jgi:predicted aspartyl protease
LRPEDRGADLPVTLDHNQIEVTGRLSGTETTFIIDTGAERSLVTAATANDMLLARSKLSVTRLTGIGGAVTNADVYADVQLGQARVQQRLAVADIPGVGGLIGGDNALLDSAASVSLVQADAARSLGVDLAKDPALAVRGVDGATVRLRMHRFNTLTIGGQSFDAPRLGVDQAPLDGTDMVLGVDYLRSRTVWIAYRTGQMFVH